MKKISPQLYEAYLNAKYQVLISDERNSHEENSAQHWHRLKPSHNDQEIAQFLASKGSNNAILITAFNPMSRQLTQKENNKRHAMLQRDLLKMDLLFVPALGGDFLNEWPDEASFFVMNVTYDDAQWIAKKYQQNAYLYVSKVGDVTLRLTADDVPFAL